MVDSGIDTGDFSFVLGMLHLCGQAHVRSHVSPRMDWNRRRGNIVSGRTRE